MRFFSVFLFVLLFIRCSSPTMEEEPVNAVDSTVVEVAETEEVGDVFIHVLGTVQDGGSPHMGCKNDCCADLFENPDPKRKIVCLGVIDRENEKSWMFEATPDFTTQSKDLKKQRGFGESEVPDGIFLTHAHIGHYAGLIFLGMEVHGAKGTPVYAMPRMKAFLETNGPWSQLVTMENIELIEMQNEVGNDVSSNIRVTPFLVPHRDEYSETVGFKIAGPTKSAIFIPDVNKWDIWEKDIIEEISKVDYAFLDATFYGQGELQHRDMADMPHPFIVESLERFKELPEQEKDKIIFIHLNHSNPALDKESKEYQHVIDLGYRIAQFGDRYAL
jgi:pyrroloquinoline quinone biosynthesis protein B